ncbi:MAG: hypothetical protein OEW16_09695 [Gammaproteobacteria bacterium]|nr:hypothetical protein [Gammaproteobacteria bacterium]
MKEERPKRKQTIRRRIRTHNVNCASGKGGRSIAADVYDAAKRAILETVPKGKVGITFPELLAEVSRRVPRRLFAGKSVAWYATTVKLDLEARGLIARVPGARPQRLVRKERASGAGSAC